MTAAAALLLMLQAVAPPPVVPDAADASAFATLKGTVVAAIRNCGAADQTGEIRVCSRDRGFAEGGHANRLPKLAKPKPPPGEPKITVQVSGPVPPDGG